MHFFLMKMYIFNARFIPNYGHASVYNYTCGFPVNFGSFGDERTGKARYVVVKLNQSSGLRETKQVGFVFFCFGTSTCILTYLYTGPIERGSTCCSLC